MVERQAAALAVCLLALFLVARAAPVLLYAAGGILRTVGLW